MSKLNWIRLLCLSLLWGGAYILINIAVTELPVFTVVTLRTGLAALFLWVVVVFRKKFAGLTPAVLGKLCLLGILNSALPFSLITWSQTHITAGLASILTAATPLFGIMFAHWLTGDEKLTLPRVLGVVLGIVGVIILVGDFGTGTGTGTETAGGSETAGGGQLLPMLAVLGASCSYSLAGIFSKRIQSGGIEPVTVTAGQLGMACLVLLPLSLGLDRSYTLPAPGTAVVLAVLAVALLSTGLAFTLFYKIVSSAGAGNALLVTMINPFVSVGLGALVLGESVVPMQMLALCVLVAGLLLVDGRLQALVKHRLLNHSRL